MVGVGGEGLIRDKIVGFHDATRLATLHDSRRCLDPSHPDTLSILSEGIVELPVRGLRVRDKIGDQYVS
jgi:hypothetical protein